MEGSAFTDHPTYEAGCFVLVIGQSRGGKTRWLKGLLQEYKSQFKSKKIKQIVYIHQSLGKDLKELQSKLKKKLVLLPDIPSDLEEICLDHSVIVFDDVELLIQKQKEKKDLLMRWSHELCHHRSWHVFLALQSYNIFYKRSVLNPLLTQATGLVIFRSQHMLPSLKRFLNAFNVKLKQKDTDLFTVFKSYVLDAPYNYLVVNLSPALAKPEVYSQVLMSDSRPLLIFHAE